jgi:hypothetical protein
MNPSANTSQSSNRHAKALAIAGIAIASQPTASQAAIVYSSESLTSFGPHFEDVDTVVPFSTTTTQRSFDQCFTQLRLGDRASNFAWASADEVEDFGDTVGATNTYTTGTDSSYSSSIGSNSETNYDRYAGFRFEGQGVGNDEVWYGWIRVQGSPSGSSPTLVEYAYENTGNMISAGAVPEPSVGLLFVAGTLLPFVGRKRGKE